ncbi:hypothetical protein L0P88_10230 [Muricauda sp. SCSIO 64092]|uniref:hypothetical protein n=1 Tax=Allomuricauda sp. SCSIO 64092 TaxID=2908842 RepID=UPI001FF3AED8|nr:hypothetical protein [Muricauda sp. SCSIO 64092]UOY08910.1 hypothetical protein L0P88_10230 [Muricauda sp. SCSIO 64092]
MKPFNFPVIRKVIINDFSLYSKNNVIELEMDKQVFCLAGANGLGKSTFVTILNYALTGIVRNPQRTFSAYNSIPAFYSKNKNFANKFFEGRIDESSRELASVEVHFELGDFNYKIERGFFEVEELRLFSRTRKSKDEEEGSQVDTQHDLNEAYMNNLADDAGLQEFSQYVFIQHFVLTFDETHQLLFWDKEMMERVLYLFFGVNPEDAKLADELRKKVKKYTSDSSNLQWDITQATKELENLISLANADDNKGKVPEEVLNEYQALTQDLNEQIDNVENNRKELKQVQLEVADYSLNLNTLKRDYEELFKHTLKPKSNIESDPKIIEIIKSLQYAINTTGNFQSILDSLVKYIKENHSLNNNKSSTELQEVLDNLKALDVQIKELGVKLNNSNIRELRLKEEGLVLEKAISENKNKISEIENKNEEFLNSLYKKKGDDLTDLVTRFRKQIENLKEKKQEAIDNKNTKRQELKELERRLKIQYQGAEEQFIPKFIDYAQSFIGLELNIRLQTYAKGTTLDLEINDSFRKEVFQLSESQRYFLDIALRMALIEHATNSCSLTVDTPEGSLDIAYESKAGKMFADFSKRSYQLIMTANINTSELLKEIAKECKSQGMKLERMINWTTLSKVQIELESRIEEAYLEIETALNE